MESGDNVKAELGKLRDAGKFVSDLCANVSNPSEIFVDNLIVEKRNEIVKECERLLEKDISDAASKFVFDCLWRFSAYDPISICRKSRSLKKVDANQLNQFIECEVTYFEQFQKNHPKLRVHCLLSVGDLHRYSYKLVKKSEDTLVAAYNAYREALLEEPENPNCYAKMKCVYEETLPIFSLLITLRLITLKTVSDSSKLKELLHCPSKSPSAHETEAFEYADEFFNGSFDTTERFNVRLRGLDKLIKKLALEDPVAYSEVIVTLVFITLAAHRYGLDKSEKFDLLVKFIMAALSYSNKAFCLDDESELTALNYVIIYAFNAFLPTLKRFVVSKAVSVGNRLMWQNIVLKYTNLLNKMDFDVANTDDYFRTEAIVLLGIDPAHFTEMELKALKSLICSSVKACDNPLIFDGVFKCPLYTKTAVEESSANVETDIQNRIIIASKLSVVRHYSELHFLIDRSSVLIISLMALKSVEEIANSGIGEYRQILSEIEKLRSADRCFVFDEDVLSVTDVIKNLEARMQNRANLYLLTEPDESLPSDVNGIRMETTTALANEESARRLLKRVNGLFQLDSE